MVRRIGQNALVLARRIAVIVVGVTGMVGLFTMYAWAMDDAHRPNPVHKRMGVLAVDGDHVGVRFVPCANERVDWIELTQAKDTRGIVLWRVEAESTGAALSADGLGVPVDIDAQHDYEVAVHTNLGEGGQEIKDGPPRDGEVLVLDRRVTEQQYAEEALDSCTD
jgi:hypothetical protein